MQKDFFFVFRLPSPCFRRQRRAIGIPAAASPRLCDISRGATTKSSVWCVLRIRFIVARWELEVLKCFAELKCAGLRVTSKEESRCRLLVSEENVGTWPPWQAAGANGCILQLAMYVCVYVWRAVKKLSGLPKLSGAARDPLAKVGYTDLDPFTV